MSGEKLSALTLEQRLAYTEILLHKATRWIEIIHARTTYAHLHEHDNDTKEYLRDVLEGVHDLAQTAVNECCDTGEAVKPGELWEVRDERKGSPSIRYRIQYIGTDIVTAVNELELKAPTCMTVQPTVFRLSEVPVYFRRIKE